VHFEVALAEDTEDDEPRSLVRRQPVARGRVGDARRALEGEAVDARRDRGKGDRVEGGFRGQLEAAPVGAFERRILTAGAAPPDRPDRMNDVARLQVVPGRDLGRARRRAAERPGLFEESRSGRAVDRAVDATAAQEGRVRGVDDRFDVERGDIRADVLDPTAEMGGDR
jgi:hypothetical protein